MKRYLIIVLLSLLVLPLMAQPKREFRASWLTTVWAIDWPASWGQTSASGQQKQQKRRQNENRFAAALLFGLFSHAVRPPVFRFCG